ncbi:hypothetical protein K402DRAFT_330715 [Aulographum hederae CBS 113979]|uniref:Stress response protein Rds1 n=1 Tax=Aulographum hederae CBS 113979 TaxID=1176131 RepID=A0A6G1H3B2_9PEZI|nr:hypothetical protein K402DRAFT_330715 [Aulographum hederae CBS 113979]
MAMAASVAFAHPVKPADPRADPSYGPIPGENALFNTYRGKAAPFPANETGPIFPTTRGRPGPDDKLFQNLMAAEWVVFSFYQQGVEAFNSTSFTEIGMPENTYDRLTEIRDNEAGHLRIFQDQISSNSIKPGQCQYSYPFSSASDYLALQLIIETTSMAFLTGLVQQAQLGVTKGALVAIAEVESRHNTWALIDIWKTNPFSGPSDTTYPYTNEILDITTRFIVPGTCPKENPSYPSPNQNLPDLTFNSSVSDAHPGQDITFIFEDPKNQPKFREGKEYYAVFFHGVFNVTMPFDMKTNSSVVPGVFDEGRGIILAIIADEPGAPTLESVVAGPSILLQQPGKLTTDFS